MRTLKLLGVLALGLVICLPGVAQASAINIYQSGFNEDEIYEINSGSGSTITKTVDNDNYATWAENLYVASNGTVNSGLPTSRSFVSATSSGVTYSFQPYTGYNALRMGKGNSSSGDLTVASGQYTTLYILATSGNAGSGNSSTIILNFSDNSHSTYTNALYAPDWYDGVGVGSSNVALGTRQRVNGAGTSIDQGTYNGNNYEANFQLYESFLQLLPADQGKFLTSITFNDATGGNGATSVYAVDGVLVPIPASVMLLGSGLLGLGLLGWRRKRS